MSKTAIRKPRAASVSKYVGDPFEIDPAHVPSGISYQWFPLERTKGDPPKDGWSHVPASDHPGMFTPFGHEGNIEFKGMVLMKRPKEDVTEEHAKMVAKAHQNVTDWMERNGAMFGGGVRVWTGNEEPPPVTPIGNPVLSKAVIDRTPHFAEVEGVVPPLPVPATPAIEPPSPSINVAEKQKTLWQRLVAFFQKDH